MSARERLHRMLDEVDRRLLVLDLTLVQFWVDRIIAFAGRNSIEDLLVERTERSPGVSYREPSLRAR